MRALELGRPLLHSSNNGITAIINANGSINKAIPQFKSLVLQSVATATTGITPYAKLGNIPIRIIEITFLSYFIFQFIKFKYIKLN